jgi:signal transduction histidine kinase
VLDPDGRVLAHRPSLPSAFFRNASLHGHQAAEIGPPALGACLHRLWESVLRHHAPCTAEVVIGPDAADPSGHLTLSLRAAVHPEATDLALITLRDLTRDRDRELLLLDTIDELRLQRDEWEAAARTVSHDVRSSLAALTGFVQLALCRHGPISTGVAEALNQALEIGRRTHALVDVVLDEARPGEHDPERVALRPLGQRLFTALRAAYPTVAFTWCVDAAEQAVRAPSAVVWDVLWNLLVNAVQYRHPKRSLHVELRAWARGAEVCIEVRDNGRGIPPRQAERIFQRGRRGSNAWDVEGNGLGLYSARRLLDACGGAIWVEPSGEGASFRMTLAGWED